MKMQQCPEESPHTSYPANRLRNCSHRGFRDFAARPRWQSHTATRAVQPQGGGGKPSVPRGSRRRHPELRLRTFNHFGLAGVAYVLFTPEATLLNDRGDQLITHFFSPNPDPHDPNTSAAVVADGAIRPTWVHSRDGSSVWAKAHTNGSFLPDKNAIPWLLLDVVGTEDGLAGGNTLSKTTQIQRLNTTGGVEPDHGCDSLADVGHTAFSNYTADYFFYTNQKGKADDGK